MERPKISSTNNRMWRLLLTDGDFAAAKRLLALLESAQAFSDDAPPSEIRKSRLARLKMAHEQLQLQQRRINILGREISAEPPYLLLLALYTREQRDLPISVGQLTKAVRLSGTTAVRWIEVLVRKGWIERIAEPDDARRSMLTLAAKARAAMDELFG